MDSKLPRIIFLRSNGINPDSRAEKEINSLLNYGYSVSAIGWDRDSNYPCRKETLNLADNSTDVYRIGIKGEFSGGFKKNIIPLIRFQRKMFFQLWRLRKSIDIIHACDFDTALTAYIFAKMFRKKLVYDIFDYYVHCAKIPKRLSSIIEKRDRKIINRADAVLICAEHRQKQIEGTNPKLLEVIHNSPTGFQENSASFDKNGRIAIVYVGVLLDNRLLQEMTEVISKRDDCELHIGGFGLFENYLREMSDKFENIHFYGKLSYKEVIELEQKCDIMTAIYNPQIKNSLFASPNKFYEALMLGKPIIMTDGVGMSDIVKDNNFGEVCEFNAESFDKAIDRIKEKYNDFDEISKKMKEMYKNKYAWSIMEERLINVYRHVWG